jgi:hypothetical protein
MNAPLFVAGISFMLNEWSFTGFCLVAASFPLSAREWK